MNRLQSVCLICFLLMTTMASKANEGDAPSQMNPIYTGVPSLTIAPDARGGGMGDIGVATSPDMASQYWNPAKNAFAWSKAGIMLSYTPWLSKLVDDIDLVNLSGYYKLGSDDRQAIGATVRYFSLGEVILREYMEDPGTMINPYEMSMDVSYSTKLSETFSGAVAFRYIRSDLSSGTDEGVPGNAYAADIAGYFNNYIRLGNSECLLGLGFNASNIGTKISFDGGTNNYFLPTNLRIGGSLLVPMDEYNNISFSLDANKLMVPTPPNTRGLSADEKRAAMDEYNSISPISGMFKSFSDAPRGMKEEFEEIMWSMGAEYSYSEQFFVRGGYFYESPNKGNRKYFSLGAGFKMSVFQLDVAYLMATAPSNPLDQTLRFSLTFDMDGLRDLASR